MSQSLFADDLMTIQQTAKRLQVSNRTVRRWIKLRQLPVHRITCRSLRVPVSALDAWLRDRPQRRARPA